jgi:predicted N-acetyltransferase YhbS
MCSGSFIHIGRVEGRVAEFIAELAEADAAGNAERSRSRFSFGKLLMKVCPAACADCDRLVRLFRQLGNAVNASDLRAGLLAYEASDADLALVSEIGGEVVGTIVLHVVTPLHKCRKWERISALVVDESIQRQGVGTELPRAADDFFVGRGCDRVNLTSSKGRLDAPFYLANGYKIRSKHFVKRYPSTR